MWVCRIAAARLRQEAAGSGESPKTTASMSASARAAFAVSAARPEPTIATSWLSAAAMVQSVPQPEVHRVRPQERGGRQAPFLDPRLVALRPQQVILRLLRTVAVLPCVTLDPVEAGPCVVDPALVGVREAEHRRQKQPLAAAVELVLEMPM